METKSNSLRYDYNAKIFLMAHSFYSLDRILKIFLDLSFLTLAYLLALFTRSDVDILFYETWFLVLPLQFLSLWYFGVFYERWRCFSIYDWASILKGVFTGLILILSLLYLTHTFSRTWVSILIIDSLYLTYLMVGARLTVKLYFDGRLNLYYLFHLQHPQARRVMVVGFKPTGLEILREIIDRPKEYYPVAIISDDATLWGKTVWRVEVYGYKDITRVARKRKVEEILLATEPASCPNLKEILECCQKHQICFTTIFSSDELKHRLGMEDQLQRVRADITTN